MDNKTLIKKIILNSNIYLSKNSIKDIELISFLDKTMNIDLSGFISHSMKLEQIHFISLKENNGYYQAAFFDFKEDLIIKTSNEFDFISSLKLSINDLLFFKKTLDEGKKDKFLTEYILNKIFYKT